MAQKPKHMILTENSRTDSEPFIPFFFNDDGMYELMEGKLQESGGNKYYFRDMSCAQWGAYTVYLGWDSNTRRKEASKLIKNLETLRGN